MGLGLLFLIYYVNFGGDAAGAASSGPVKDSTSTSSRTTKSTASGPGSGADSDSESKNQKLNKLLQKNQSLTGVTPAKVSIESDKFKELKVNEP